MKIYVPLQLKLCSVKYKHLNGIKVKPYCKFYSKLKYTQDLVFWKQIVSHMYESALPLESIFIFHKNAMFFIHFTYTFHISSS